METVIAELAKNARHTMGGLFKMDPYQLSCEETVEILMKAINDFYREI